MTQQEILEKVGNADVNFKQRLLDDPQGALKGEFPGFEFPSTIEVHENNANEMHVIFSTQEEFVFSADLEDSVNQVLDKALVNNDFKKLLVADPKGTLTKELPNYFIPENFKIFFHENASDSMHLLAPTEQTTGEELSEADLDAVAGGGRKGPHVGRSRGGKGPKCRSQKFRR